MHHPLMFLLVLLLSSLTTLSADDAQSVGSNWDQEISTRQTEYLNWIVEHFGRIESSMKPLDGRAWPLNQARLFLNRDIDKASRYFESVKLTFDADFMGIRLLKTWLDFRKSDHLSNKAKEHLRIIIRDWPMDRKRGISRTARWPPGFTENHDLMHLTIGLFSEQVRGQSIERQLNELKRFLSWRFERGFYEWGSHRYQLHYTNPLIVLATFAPDPDIRRGAADQLSIILAERALMSVGGYLGGPGMRSYDLNRGCDYLDNNRYDSFLPTVWLALGVAEPRFDFSQSNGLAPAGDGYGNGRDPRLNQDEAMFLATTNARCGVHEKVANVARRQKIFRTAPRSGDRGYTLFLHPIVKDLLEEVSTRPELIYTGRRASAGHPFQNAQPGNPRSQQAVVYYNTPHVSMGSLQFLPEAGKMSVSYNSRPRFFSIMFPEKPEQVLRTRLTEADLEAGAKSYNYRADRVVQHRDWLVAAGEPSASHGLTSQKSGTWDLFRVGRGLCAHMELPGGWHVFQVADLEKFKDEKSFVAALQTPTIRNGYAHGAALNGDRVRVNLDTMAIDINGVARPSLMGMLHDSPFMTSEFGSGRITIRASGREVIFDNSALQYKAAALPKLAGDHSRWGNSHSHGDTTKLAHVRAMGGLSPRDRDCQLKSVSILIPQNNNTSARLAVYAGGSLEEGPHSDSSAKLLFDFGPTPRGKAGWVTLEHPTGVRIPANTPVWIAWKGEGDASVMYVEDEPVRDDFQPERGRWDSKTLPAGAEQPWPQVWPSSDTGGFDAARYSCFLELMKFN